MVIIVTEIFNQFFMHKFQAKKFYLFWVTGSVAKLYVLTFRVYKKKEPLASGTTK